MVSAGRRSGSTTSSRSTRAACSAPARSTCVDGPELDELIAFDPDYSTDAGIQDVIDMYGELGAALPREHRRRRSGTSTPSARPATSTSCARRSATTTLTYLGFSYGTELGATYAALFPDEGRPPGPRRRAAAHADLPRGRRRARPSASRTPCAPTSPTARPAPAARWTGRSTTGSRRSASCSTARARNPLPTGTDRDLTGSLAFYGIALPLYSQSYWPLPDAGPDGGARQQRRLDAAPAGRPVLRPASRTAPTARTRWSRSTRSTAWTARDPADFDAMRAEAAQIEEAAPTVGYVLRLRRHRVRPVARPRGRRASTPTPPRAPRRSSSSAPRTTRRRRTQWAEELADLLSSGVLLTYEGEGHTAYGSSNDCIADAVDAYLLGGDVPADGTRC